VTRRPSGFRPIHLVQKGWLLGFLGEMSSALRPLLRKAALGVSVVVRPLTLCTAMPSARNVDARGLSTCVLQQLARRTGAFDPEEPVVLLGSGRSDLTKQTVR
jgi:hypothetical protein